MFFDPLYLLFMLPGLILAGLASFFTHSTFNKYSRVGSSSGMTGAEAARRLLETAGIYNVTIEHVNGMLSDHYDPSSRTLRLSDGVYGSNSLSAIGVACHEAGHAIQHATNYAPLGMRSALVPAWSAVVTRRPSGSIQPHKPHRTMGFSRKCSATFTTAWVGIQPAMQMTRLSKS